MTSALIRRALKPAAALSIAAGLGLVVPTTLSTAATPAASPSAGLGIPLPPLPALVGKIIPLTANTCSGSVCIYVNGSGLTVTSWSSSVIIAKAGCSTPKFLVNGAVRKTGPSICGSANNELEYVWTAPGSFGNGNQLCNTWSGASGEPCITVHS